MKKSQFLFATLGIMVLAMSACLGSDDETSVAADPTTDPLVSGRDKGLDECKVEECGPPLGMPTILCEDGSLGGNTGRCLLTERGDCAWEIRECPEETDELCDVGDCGPPLGMPTIICEDGSLGGNTGRCLRSELGRCFWEIRDCP